MRILWLGFSLDVANLPWGGPRPTQKMSKLGSVRGKLAGIVVALVPEQVQQCQHASAAGSHLYDTQSERGFDHQHVGLHTAKSDFWAPFNTP